MKELLLIGGWGDHSSGLPPDFLCRYLIGLLLIAIVIGLLDRALESGASAQLRKPRPHDTERHS